MKRKILSVATLLIMLVLCLGVTAFAGDVTATEIAISNKIKVLTETSTGERLTVMFTPADTTNQVIDWSSDNENVCKVDTNGYLIPVANGSCVITAATTDGSYLTESCKVTVADAAISITIDETGKNVKVDDEFTLTVQVVTKSGFKHNAASWSSSNEKVATVDENGVVTAHYPGSARITAKAFNGTTLTKASCLVNVTQDVEGVTLPSSKVCNVGSSITLTPEIQPSYASDKSVMWVSSDTSVATISGDGVVTGKKVGSTVISVITKDGGYAAECTVNVEKYPTAVSLNTTSLKIDVGTTKVLTAKVTPSDATTKTVTWKSSDTSVVEVSSSGKITAVAGGKATVTATTKRGAITAACTVTVNEYVSGVSIENAPETMYLGQTYTLKSEVVPSTASDKSVTWESSHPDRIKVDAKTGKLTALKKGRAKITVTTTDGSYKYFVKITVTDKIDVKGVKLNVTAKRIPKGSTFTLKATITPSDASDKRVNWYSSDESIATVSSAGVVKGIKSGLVYITCKTVDGEIKAKCKVRVTLPVTGVSLNKTSLSLGTERKASLKAIVAPENATEQTVTWKSSDTSVATVDQKGVVTGVKKGTAKITATTKDGSYKATCTVTVYRSVKSIKLDIEETDLPKGEKISLKTTVSPANADNKTLVWSSSDTSVATVSSTGVVKAKRKGTAVITAKTQDSGASVSCTVNVVILAEKITVSSTSVRIEAGKRKALTYTLSPSNVSDKTVKWKSSDKTVVRVSQEGIFKALKPGTATVTVTSGDGEVKAKCKVTVIQAPTGVTVTADKKSVKVGAELKLSADVLPANASDKSVEWTSSDNSVAVVDTDGTVTGLKAGKVKITATVKGGFSDTVKITVKQPVESVKLNKTLITLTVGRKSALTATVLPANASNQKVVWKSSNNDVATVSEDGIVTAVSPGYTVIKVVTSDGKKTASCQVKVVSAVSGVKLNKTKLTLEKGEKFTLVATVLPSTALNKNVTWVSKDTSVVKVSAKGVVTAVGKGTAKVYVKTADGNYKKACTVTVK